MSEIKILEQSLINQIAAGEVIERPGSVIKELVENSIDAGSTRIDITVRDGGRTYISVQDNGFGMSQEDLTLSIQRHATSKLKGRNLLDVHSFGFRGEALPAICSVGRVEIKTCQKDEPLGWFLKVEGGEVLTLEPVVHNVGTFFSIRDLFYTTPARLKFLKMNTTELSYCVQSVKQLALSNPGVAFSLTHGEKNTLAYPAESLQEGEEKAFLQRIRNVLGESFVENSYWVQRSMDDLNCFCWVCLPTYHTSVSQYCFVNKRPVKDRQLMAVVRTAYQDVLMQGEQPSFVLFLTLDPQEVDMNVHPTKSEVRFRDMKKIRALVLATVRDALAKSSNKTTSELSERFSARVQVEPIFFNQHEETSETAAKATVNAYRPSFHQQDHYRGSSSIRSNVLDLNAFESGSPLKEETELFLGQAKTQIFDSFIISQKGDDFFIIDQHAAHERIVYENIEKGLQVDGNGWIVSKFPKQKLLTPETIKLSEEDHLGIQEFLPYFTRMGFEMTVDETLNLKLTEVPSIFAEANPVGLFQEILRELMQTGINSSLLERIHRIFATYACHHSVRANHLLSKDEMDALLRQIEKTARSGQCNHGRPSYVHMTRAHIEKLFERIR